MTVDPVLIEFVKGYLLPVIGVGLFLYQLGATQRATNKLMFGIIARLVNKGVFDARDLLDLGVLEAAQQSSLNSGDLLKLLAGAIK